jgi:hypothetical protein
MTTLAALYATPAARILGAFASWFLFALNFTLLYFVATTVMSLGGSCANGGPYVVAVHCPANVDLFAPGSVFGGLFAVFLGATLARGFGFPLLIWAWPVLFCGLGAVFLLEGVIAGDPVGWIIGSLFEIMGAVPLVLELRGSAQRVFLGTNNASGVRFTENARAQRSMMVRGAPNPEGAVRPASTNWLATVGLLAVAIWAGFVVANLWFFGTPGALWPIQAGAL